MNSNSQEEPNQPQSTIKDGIYEYPSDYDANIVTAFNNENLYHDVKDPSSLFSKLAKGFKSIKNKIKPYFDIYSKINDGITYAQTLDELRLKEDPYYGVY